SVFLENFFVRQGERAFREGEKEREYLYKKLTSLRASVSSRLQKTAGTDLSQAQLHDLATHVRTGKLLGKRKATWDQAIVAFEQALLLDPNHFEALTEMAIILSSRGSVSEAKELFSRALLVATTAEEKASVNQQLSLLP
ncbi:tetratricopeptide repeat protein, partial [Myxococcota bacterium]|nr:tetratricopeptide repeat protein [Myxococcota bacterium]